MNDDFLAVVLCDTARFVLTLFEVKGAAYYEVVDRVHEHETLLTGEAALGMALHTDSWRCHAPDEDEINTVLESYCILGRIPVKVH